MTKLGICLWNPLMPPNPVYGTEIWAGKAEPVASFVSVLVWRCAKCGRDKVSAGQPRDTAECIADVSRAIMES